jgi:WD40 repeat protein
MINIANLDGNILKTLHGHTNWVWRVIKLDGTSIASCSEDNTIKIWDIESGELLHTFQENNPVISLAFHYNTRQLICGNLTGEISIRTLTDNHKLQTIQTFKAHTSIIRTIKFIDDDIIATGGEDNKVKLWRLTGQLLTEWKHQNFVQSIELLNPHTIISASYDGTIKTCAI